MVKSITGKITLLIDGKPFAEVNKQTSLRVEGKFVREQKQRTMIGFWGYERKDGGYVCATRAPKEYGGLGALQCGCAQFDDGSCVPSEVYPEYSKRRDCPKRARDNRDFAKREAYA